MIVTSERLRPRSRVLVAEYPLASTFGPRRLRDHEFVWLLEGSATWVVERSGMRHEVPLRPGRLALARPDDVDHYTWDGSRTSTHAYVHFTVEDDSGGETWPLVRDLEEHPPLGGLCSYLLDLAASRARPAELRSTQVLALLLDVFVAGPFPEAAGTPRLPPPLRSALDFVRETWSAGGMRIVRVEELAAAAAVSPAHLSRTFSRELGVGPSTALELLRLGRAAQLLQRSNLSLAEIARLTGFSNPYHFSRRFTSAYAVPPGRYRRAGDAHDPLAPLARAGLVPMWQSLAQGLHSPGSARP